MPAIGECFGVDARRETRSLSQEDVSTLIVELATGCGAPGLYGKNQPTKRIRSTMIEIAIKLTSQVWARHVRSRPVFPKTSYETSVSFMIKPAAFQASGWAEY